MIFLNGGNDTFLWFNLEVWKTIIIPLILLVFGWIGKIVHDYVRAKYFPRSNKKQTEEKHPFDINISIDPTQKGIDIPILNDGILKPNKYLENLNAIIDTHLKDLIENNDNVDRAWVGRFHDNNGNYINYPNKDVNWQIFSLVFTKNRCDGDDDIEIINKLKHIPLILYKPVLDRVLTNGFFYINNIRKLPTPLYYIFKKINVKSLCIMGLFNRNLELEGLIGVESTNLDVNLTKELLQNISNTGKIIVEFLPLTEKIT